MRYEKSKRDFEVLRCRVEISTSHSMRSGVETQLERVEARSNGLFRWPPTHSDEQHTSVTFPAKAIDICQKSYIFAAELKGRYYDDSRADIGLRIKTGPSLSQV